MSNASECGDGPENEELGTFSASNIDIDAIASAKSLGDAMRLLAPQLEGLPRRSRGKYGKRKHLSPEEKAELTRRRNRENARSTRMRRKMYIKHLQEVAQTLKERHDELNRKMATPPPDGYARQREAARRFFEMRGDCVTSADDWLQVVASDCVVTLPATPYREFEPAELEAGENGVVRQLVGADALVRDCRSLRNLLADLAERRGRTLAELQPAKRRRTAGGPALSFRVDPGSVVHVKDKYMCQWTCKIALLEDDIQVSIQHSGMAKCTFNAQNLLATVDLRFDVGAFTALLADFASHLPPSTLA